jgi:hypothetical protein
MKRDMDLIRSILLELEASQKPMYFNNPKNIYRKLENRYDLKQIWYHLELLEDACLIVFVENEDEIIEYAPSKYEHPRELGRMTWEGHEFLEAAKNEPHWNRAKEIIKEKGSGLTFDILKA